MLDEWCRECSSTSVEDNRSTSTNSNVVAPTPTLSWSYIGGHGNDLQKHALTSTDSRDNPWYAVFESAIATMDIDLEPQVFPAATDSRFLRALGIKAFGFSPMRRTDILLHENDEYIPESTFLEGIAVYVTVIMALGSQGKEMDSVIE
jgi:aminoacylase